MALGLKQCVNLCGAIVAIYAGDLIDEHLFTGPDLGLWFIGIRHHSHGLLFAPVFFVHEKSTHSDFTDEGNKPLSLNRVL